MPKIALLILFIFSGIFLKAQTNLDLLYTIWKEESMEASTRVMFLRDFIQRVEHSNDPDNTCAISEELVSFAKEKQDPRFEAWAYSIQGHCSHLRGNYQKALEYNTKSLELREAYGTIPEIASSLNSIGLIYKDLGNYSEALNFYLKSLKRYDENEYKRGPAFPLNNIGGIYHILGNYSEAMHYFTEALKINEELGEQGDVAISLGNIGIVYRDQGDLSQAMDYQMESLEIRKAIRDSLGIASSLGNIGILYTRQGKSEEALSYYMQSLKISERIGNVTEVANVLESRGEVFIEQGKYEHAINECDKSLKISEDIESVIMQMRACKCLYRAFKGLNTYNKALAYHERMLVLKDSLNAIDINNELQEMEFAKLVLQNSIEEADKQRDIQKTHDEEIRNKEITRNYAIWAGVLFFILAGGFYSRWRYIRKSKAIIEKEKDRSDSLLRNILPEEIAEELKEKGRVDAQDFDTVSILFTDFKGFTHASAKMSAQDLVYEVNHCFEAFDGITEKYGIEKIKTIGDSYMAAGGMPTTTPDSVINTVLGALEMQKFISARKVEMDAAGKPGFEMRLGIHTGPIVAGIVGVKKFQYDIWGDAVNTASRMESMGEVGRVNISQTTYEMLKDFPDFVFEKRGKVEVKGKGEMEMWFVDRRMVPSTFE